MRVSHRVSHRIQLALQRLSFTDLCQEGIFRKTGSVSRQQELKFMVNQFKPLNLKEFTCHDVASVMKSILADLPEPLLTEVWSNYVGRWHERRKLLNISTQFNLWKWWIKTFSFHCLFRSIFQHIRRSPISVIRKRTTSTHESKTRFNFFVFYCPLKIETCSSRWSVCCTRHRKMSRTTRWRPTHWLLSLLPISSAHGSFNPNFFIRQLRLWREWSASW